MIDDDSNNSPVGWSVLLLAAGFFMLAFLPSVASCQEKTKPLAADLVEDGQLIDLTS